MRVKVGDTWHEVELEKPLMVELTEADKKNIANMHPSATKYAEFHDDTALSRPERQVWMEATNEGEDTEDALHHNPISMQEARVLHFFHPRTKHSPSAERDGRIYTRWVELGNEDHLKRLIGLRWDFVHVHGYLNAGQFVSDYHAAYDYIMKNSKPETQFYYWEE